MSTRTTTRPHTTRPASPSASASGSDGGRVNTVGIGFGAANISLAIAAQESDCLDGIRFLEAASGPQWQPGMLLSSSDIQNNPVRDLVSLRNPRSRFSFINYLHEQGRLLDFLNLPVEFPLRKDFARYISWAGTEVGAQVTYSARVTGISRDGSSGFTVRSSDGEEIATKTVVVATGRTPYIPEQFESLRDERVMHSTSYLFAMPSPEDMPEGSEVLIVGTSQSAIELALDLLGRYPTVKVTLLSRGLGPRLKDVSPFSEHAYFPEFTDYYHGLDRTAKTRVDAGLRASNYSSVDGDVLNELYVKMYEQRLDGDVKTRLRPFTEVVRVSADERLRVTLVERNTSELSTAEFDRIILATGFKDLGPGRRQETVPPLLNGLRDDLHFDDDGYLTVTDDYELLWRDGERSGIFLNGLCESSHGLGDAGSFSLLSLRAGTILKGTRAGVARHESRVEGIAL